MSATAAGDLRRSPMGRWATFRHFLLDADYLSVANKYLPWRSAFGSLCLVAIAAVLCGFFVNFHAHVLLAAVLVVLAIGTVWPWISTRGLRATLSFAVARAREHEAVGVRLDVSNWLPVGARGVRVRGGLVAGDGADVSLAVVPGWRQTRFEWNFTPACRGEYPVVPPQVTSGFPFGLWEAGRPAPAAASLLVWPAVFSVSGVPEAASNCRSREGVVLQNRTGDNGDILGVRPYRRGDPRRRIHWAQTARHDRLIVCERQAISSPRAQVVLDADPRSHRGTAPSGSREWAIRVAASVIEGLLKQGVCVEAVWGGRVFCADAGEVHRRRLLDSLARLPATTAVGLTELLHLPACGRFTEGVQIVVTTDAGLAGVTDHGLLRRSRCVVLSAAAFAGDQHSSTRPPLPARPWIWIDQPDRVAEQFRHAWKGVLCVG
jgi:uncharacterized protein (DUF58 family)